MLAAGHCAITTGCWLLCHHYWLLAAVPSLLAAGYCAITAGCWLLCHHCWLLHLCHHCWRLLVSDLLTYCCTVSCCTHAAVPPAEHMLIYRQLLYCAAADVDVLNCVQVGFFCAITYWREIHFYWCHRGMHPWYTPAPIETLSILTCCHVHLAFWP